MAHPEGRQIAQDEIIEVSMIPAKLNYHNSFVDECVHFLPGSLNVEIC